MSFKKAVRTAKKAKIALDGPSGSGKTATALRLARGLAGPSGKVGVIDTERGSASLYAGRFGGEWDVDDELPDYSPKGLMERIRNAERGGYAALVIDSLSHFWMGAGGELEMVDAAKKRSRSGDGFGAWKEVTPIHNELIQRILTSKLHIVCTMRTKTEWVIEKNDQGKNAPRKVGTAPVMRDGMEYEFDLYLMMDQASGVVSKTRLEVAPLGSAFKEPGEALGEKIAAWLASGTTAEPQKPAGGAQQVSAYERILAKARSAGVPEARVKSWLRGNGVASSSQVPDSMVVSFAAFVETVWPKEQVQAPPPEPGEGG